ncbi:hypothetical protein ACFV23_38190 [Streptomyces sp. NPDC059627]
MGSAQPFAELPHKDTLSLDQSVPTCTNIAHTDQHAAGLQHHATALDQRAAHAPGPLGERLHGNAERLRDLADAHHRTRITLQDGTA